MGWSFSKSSFRMPKPHETHNTKDWYSTSWYSTSWYRFIYLFSLCFNLLTPSEAKNKAPAPKENQQEQQKSSLLYSHRLSARSALIRPSASSRNSILHPLANLSEKAVLYSCLTCIKFVLLKNPQLCWSSINDCETAALSSFCHARSLSSFHFSSIEIFLQLCKPFHGGIADRKLTSGWVHGVILNSV